MQSIKLVVVGDDCGRGVTTSKRMFLYNYINRTDKSEYYPAVIDNTSLNITLDGKNISLGLWDTSGQEDYDRLRPLSYPQTDLFLLLFSIDSPVSFRNIESKWHPEVSHHCPNALIVMVGFGNGCRTDETALEELKRSFIKPVTEREALQMANRLDCQYFECTTRPESIENDVIFPALRLILKPPLRSSKTKKKKLEMETRYRLKLLVLGHGGSGKTSLLNAMGERKKVKQLSMTESTIGFDVFHLPISKKVDFSIYDFAGQLEYLTSHKYFLSTKSALYMVIVDASQSVQSQKDQLQHWFQLLQTELPLGLNTKYTVILVGTKIDKIKDFALQRPDIEKNLLEEIERWNLNTPHLWKNEISTVWFISSSDGSGVEKLRTGLTNIGQQLAMQGTPNIPKLYRTIEDILHEESEKLSLFMDSDIIYYLVIKKLVNCIINDQHDYLDKLLWGDFIEYQHDIGTMMFLPSNNMICLNPNILSKMMSLFIAPEEHIHRLQGATSDGGSRSAIVSHLMALKRLSSMAELVKYSDVDLEKILEFLEILGICYKLKEREEESYGQGGYMFLSLRPSADLLMIPSMEGDHTEIILRRTCTPVGGCISCGYRMNGPLNLLPSMEAPKCPRCLLSSLSDLHKHTGEGVSKVLYQDTKTLSILAINVEGVRTEWPKEYFGCIEEISGLKYLAIQISSMLHAGITKDNFTRFQTKLRDLHDMRYKVYTNGILLRDFFGNQILCQHVGPVINVTIRGVVPVYWNLSLQEVIDFMKGTVRSLCPACVQGCFYTPVKAGVCSRGHKLSDDHLQNGYPLDENLLSSSTLWGPKGGDNFFSDGRWTQQGKLFYTEITPNEKNPARFQEYEHIRDMFYTFIGRDKETDMTLNKVIFFQNDELEKSFKEFYDGLTSKSLQSQQINQKTKPVINQKLVTTVIITRTILDPQPDPTTLTIPFEVQATESYTAEGDTQLSLEAGKVYSVFRLDDYWWDGESESGAKGWFPKKNVAVVEKVVSYVSESNQSNTNACSSKSFTHSPSIMTSLVPSRPKEPLPLITPSKTKNNASQSFIAPPSDTPPPLKKNEPPTTVPPPKDVSINSNELTNQNVSSEASEKPTPPIDTETPSSSDASINCDLTKTPNPNTKTNERRVISSAKATYDTKITRPHHPSRVDTISPERQEWQQWIMQHLDKYTARVSGNESVNLIAGWHGSSEESCFKIAENNFWEPSEIKNATDPGYFGRGVYFTQFPSYGTKYADKKKQCMLVSWIIMGKVYPVTESPTDPDNLLGKPKKEGFDSHYVIVKRLGKESSTIYLPCKPNQTPDYDEVVVFSKKQILPRYLIYFTRNNRVGIQTSLGESKEEMQGSSILPLITHSDIPLEIRDAHLVVLWIVPHPTERIQLMKGWLMDNIGRLVIIQHAFYHEFKNWITKWGLDNIHKLSIVIFPPTQDLTENRKEESDTFIDQVITLLADDKNWNHINLLYYSDNHPPTIKRVKKVVFGDNQPSKLFEFCIPKTTAQFLDGVVFDMVCASGVLTSHQTLKKCFTFTIISGSNLSSKEYESYCIFGFIDRGGKFEKNLFQKTTKKKSKDPKWTKEDLNSKEFFFSQIPCLEFKIECWASKALGDELLGQFSFSLLNLETRRNGQQEMELLSKDGKASGSLLVIRWEYR